MKKIALLRTALFSSLLTTALVACGDSGTSSGDPDAPINNPDAPPGAQTIMVPAGDITADTVWEGQNTYILQGPVFVTGGTLTIQAGATIKGETGSVLVITKTGKINAAGTASAPIVFTSAQASPVSGDWGGVVMLGTAPINVQGGTNLVEGFPESVGDKVSYGGSDAAYNCGTLQYARIEFAGYELSPDNELNALTVGACGTGTKIDHIQAHLGLDDGIEVFGGTVKMSHLLITQPDDDGLDWDLGWTGGAQFVIVQMANGRGNNAFEVDSNKNNNDASPRNTAQIWNFTLIGGDGASADKQGAMHLRRGTAGVFANGIISYFPTYAIDIDGASSVAQWQSGALAVKNTYFLKAAASDLWPTDFDVANGTQNDCVNKVCLDEAVEFAQNPRANQIGTDANLTAPKNLSAPSFKPMQNSGALSGAPTPAAGFDQSATYFGAVGATDWTTGWTAFPSQNN